MIDNDILRYRTLTGSFESFKLDPNRRLISLGLFPAAPPVDGSIAEWDVLAPIRDLVSFEGKHAPASPLKLQTIAHETATMAKTLKSKDVVATYFQDLRKIGSNERDARAAEDTIAREQMNIRRVIDIQDEFMESGILQGTLDMTLDGLAHSIDSGIVASHKFANGNVDAPIATPWSEADADVVGLVSDIKKRIARDSGYNAAYAICGPDVLSAIRKNDQFINIFGGTESGAEISRTGMIQRWEGLNWIEYLGTYLDADNVPQYFIPSGMILFCPLPDRNWAETLVGTLPVPRDDDSGWDFVGGPVSYAEVKRNPVGIAIYGGKNRLPVLHVPGAVANAQVLF
ncbi:MAG TPA: major capsid protein [Planctomycetota bacterium]|nr:major capsid protein [Planctomycetota bacterium]